MTTDLRLHPKCLMRYRDDERWGPIVQGILDAALDDCVVEIRVSSEVWQYLISNQLFLEKHGAPLLQTSRYEDLCTGKYGYIKKVLISCQGMMNLRARDPDRPGTNWFEINPDPFPLFVQLGSTGEVK